MSGDYETLEMNQPNIKYLKKKSRKWYRMVRWINQPNWIYEKQYIQTCLMTEKELRELEKFAEENGYNEELKDIYLREVIDKNKEYEWDKIFDQIFD